MSIHIGTRLRRYALLWHRYAGLFMAAFLAVAGLTGSLLAFHHEIDRWVAPHLYATPQPGVQALDLPTLAERAKALVPHATVTGAARTFPDQAVISFTADKDPATGKPYKLGFTSFVVDPWTGKELGRKDGDNIAAGLENLTTFILHLHDRLLTGPGYLFMGIVALVWTVDCFVAFYLTMPIFRRGFWRQWKPAWLIRRDAGVYRLNLDLHRACGLWLWPMLFVFAWSSVGFNLRYPVFNFVMKSVFDYESQVDTLMKLAQRGKRSTEPGVTGRIADDAPAVPPLANWREAAARGRSVLEERARADGFQLGDAVALGYIPPFRAYAYGAHTSRDINPNGGSALVMFEENGNVLLNLVASGQHTGNTVETWLSALHTTMGFGRWYQVFVAVLGVVIAMFSVTGVYLWWAKRRVRRLRRTRRQLSEHPGVAQ